MDGGETKSHLFCSNQSCSFFLGKYDGALRIPKLVLIRPKSSDVLTVWSSRTPPPHGSRARRRRDGGSEDSALEQRERELREQLEHVLQVPLPSTCALTCTTLGFHYSGQGPRVQWIGSPLNSGSTRPTKTAKFLKSSKCHQTWQMCSSNDS